jgi:hypothetical protein
MMALEPMENEMSSTTAAAGTPDPRTGGEDDRRLLHRGDDGRRAGDAAATRNALPPREAVRAEGEGSASTYLGVLAALFAVLWAAVIYANYAMNPLIYSAGAKAAMAEALAAGHSYGLYDLNIDTRGLRREHIRRMTETPEVVVLGASHWQEGSPDLLPHRRFYNAHVHRDYYEDYLGVTEMLVANGRLPKTMIISVRDLIFTPVAARTDDLWRTGLPEYRAMARRLGVTPHSWSETFAIRPWLDLVSLKGLWTRAQQIVNAPARPGPTDAQSLEALDVWHPQGHIRWSARHDAMFTPARTIALAEHDFEQLREQRIAVDPHGIEAFSHLLAYLVERKVRVVLIHPPYNPVFSEQIAGTPFGNSMDRIAALTADLARAHGVEVYGSFDPGDVGCDASLFIDSHHSRAACLAKILAQIPDL